jgi:hypothetical protein
MTANIPDRHPVILRLLRLLSSEEEQLAYERNVPHVDITAELRCMWFDDEYHPDDAFFRSCFSADELAALAEFHRFYDEQKHRLPQSQGTVRTWLASPVWREIMLEAKKASDRLEPNRVRGSD